MRKFKSIILLSILISMAALFTACSSEPLSTASIREVFYTTESPTESTFYTVSRVTELKFEKYYYLVIDFYEPEMNVVKAKLYLDDKFMGDYNIESVYENQFTTYENVYWTVPSNYNNEEYTLNLTFVLEDEKGRRSAPYKLNVTVQGVEYR
ncbi:MAG: hypothetical protein MJ179_09610 [Treponema sp.]|nr:hypothetical protein [Treponema sp.]